MEGGVLRVPMGSDCAGQGQQLAESRSQTLTGLGVHWGSWCCPLAQPDKQRGRQGGKGLGRPPA